MDMTDLPFCLTCVLVGLVYGLAINDRRLPVPAKIVLSVIFVGVLVIISIGGYYANR